MLVITGGDCGLQTVLDADLPPGDYILVIEGFSSSEGVYSVTMICDSADTGAITNTVACEETIVGSTVGVPSNLGNPSGEILYAFSLGVDMAVQFDSCASSFDTYLRIASPALDAELEGCDE